MELSDELSDRGPQGLDGTGGDLSQESLELGEQLLDRIEVRRIGRQVAQLSAGGFDRFPYAGDLVARQVVENDDVAGLERRNQHLADIGAIEATGAELRYLPPYSPDFNP